MNTIIKLLLPGLFLASVFTMNAAVELTLIPVNGICVSDCGVEASVDGNTSGGSVTYSLINYPTSGQNITQTSGSFTGLQPGTYTVRVYTADGTDEEIVTVRRLLICVDARCYQ